MEAFKEHSLFITQLINDKETLPRRANESFRRFNEACNSYNRISCELEAAKRANSTGDGTERFSQTHFAVLESELEQARNAMAAARNELYDVISACSKKYADIEKREREIESTFNSLMAVNSINGRANANLDKKTQTEIANMTKRYISVYEEYKCFFTALVQNIKNINFPQGGSSSADSVKSLFRHNESDEKTYKYR